MSSPFCLSCGGAVPVKGVDDWFIQRFYMQEYSMTEREWDTLFMYLRRLFAQGDLSGYDFLFAMPEPEFEEWVIKARRDLRRVRRESPEDWKPAGVLETFNKIRVYRKERSKMKKRKAAASKQQSA